MVLVVLLFVCRAAYCASLSQVPNAMSVCYKEELQAWEAMGCKVVTTTAKTFSEAFDDDDTLAYDPEATAAIVLSERPETCGVWTCVCVCVCVWRRAGRVKAFVTNMGRQADWFQSE